MKWKRRNRGERSPFLPRLLFLAAFFLSGVVLGQALVGRVPDETGRELNRYLESYLTLEDGSLAPGNLWAGLLLYGRYPLLAFLLGFASIGVVLLPLVTAAFGFFLSFSVSCFTAAFGREGVLLALAVFGLRCAVTLPCYFLLAVPALGTSGALASLSLGRGRRAASVIYGRECWRRLAVCAGVLVLGLCEELLFGQRILHLLLERLLV